MGRGAQRNSYVSSPDSSSDLDNGLQSFMNTKQALLQTLASPEPPQLEFLQPVAEEEESCLFVEDEHDLDFHAFIPVKLPEQAELGTYGSSVSPKTPVMNIATCKRVASVEKVSTERSCVKEHGTKELPAAAVCKPTAVPGRVCASCGTSTTPLWRNGPLGPKSLCNACGVRDGRRASKGWAVQRSRKGVKNNPAWKADGAAGVKTGGHGVTEGKVRVEGCINVEGLSEGMLVRGGGNEYGGAGPACQLTPSEDQPQGVTTRGRHLRQAPESTLRSKDSSKMNGSDLKVFRKPLAQGEGAGQSDSVIGCGVIIRRTRSVRSLNVGEPKVKAESETLEDSYGPESHPLESPVFLTKASAPSPFSTIPETAGTGLKVGMRRSNSKVRFETCVENTSLDMDSQTAVSKVGPLKRSYSDNLVTESSPEKQVEFTASMKRQRASSLHSMKPSGNASAVSSAIDAQRQHCDLNEGKLTLTITTVKDIERISLAPSMPSEGPSSHALDHHRKQVRIGDVEMSVGQIGGVSDENITEESDSEDDYHPCRMVQAVESAPLISSVPNTAGQGKSFPGSPASSKEGNQLMHGSSNGIEDGLMMQSSQENASGLLISSDSNPNHLDNKLFSQHDNLGKAECGPGQVHLSGTKQRNLSGNIESLEEIRLDSEENLDPLWTMDCSDSMLLHDLNMGGPSLNELSMDSKPAELKPPTLSRPTSTSAENTTDGDGNDGDDATDYVESIESMNVLLLAQHVKSSLGDWDPEPRRLSDMLQPSKNNCRAQLGTSACWSEEEVGLGAQLFRSATTPSDI